MSKALLGLTALALVAIASSKSSAAPGGNGAPGAAPGDEPSGDEPAGGGATDDPQGPPGAPEHTSPGWPEPWASPEPEEALEDAIREDPSCPGLPIFTEPTETAVRALPAHVRCEVRRIVWDQVPGWTTVLESMAGGFEALGNVDVARAIREVIRRASAPDLLPEVALRQRQPLPGEEIERSK